MKKSLQNLSLIAAFVAIFALTMWAWREEGATHNTAKWVMIVVMVVASLEEIGVVITGPKGRVSKIDRRLFRVFHAGGAIMSAAILGYIVTGSLWFDLGIVAGLVIAIWATLKKAKNLSDKAKKK
jgi:hypothetical protein